MRDDDDDDVMSAKDYAEQDRAGFTSSTLNLPEGVTLFKLDSTKTRYIDIIPYKVGKGNEKADPGELHYERTYYVHKGLGADGKGREVCLAKTFKKPCPICKLLDKQKASGDIDEDTFKKLSAKTEQLFNVIDAEDPKKGIQLWPINRFFFGKALTEACQALDDDDEEQFFASYKRGSTLKLTVEENKFAGRTSYKVARVDFKRRKKQYQKSITEDAYCLDDLIKRKSPDELKKVFLAIDDDTDDSDSNSKKKGKKNMAKKAPAIEKGDMVEWDEVDGELKVLKVSGKHATLKDEDGEKHEKVPLSELTLVSDDDDDDDEDEKPKKGGKKKPAKKSSKKDDDDDDDDDDSDDDDDDSEDDDDDDSDDDDEDDDDEDEDSDDDDDDSDDDDDDSDDDDDDEDSEDDEDDDSDDDDDDDDDEDEKPAKKKAAKKKPAKKAPAKKKGGKKK